MHSLIDLTRDDEDHKTRIMAQAAAVLSQRTQTGNHNPSSKVGPTPPVVQEQIVIDDDDDELDEEKERSKRPRHHTDSTQHDQLASPHASSSQPPMYPLNDMLRVLHQERQARMQGGEPKQAGQGPQHTAQPKKRKSDNSEQPSGSQGFQPASGPSQQASNSGRGEQRATEPAKVSILTYNLWFEEGVALEQRMRGLMDVISELKPDVIMFQEVTPNMLLLWQRDHAPFLAQYTLSMPPEASYFTLLGYKTASMQTMSGMQRTPFLGSVMGRDVTCICLRPKQPFTAPPLLVATSHLESPMGREESKKYCASRELQLDQGVHVLESRASELAAGRTIVSGNIAPAGSQSVDICWGGDMNWIPDHKAEPKLPAGWQDVWPGHRRERGATWDPTTNDLLRGLSYRPGRLDRYFARLNHWHVDSIELVGTNPIPGATVNRRNKTVNLHVSDHHGLLLKLTA